MEIGRRRGYLTALFRARGAVGEILQLEDAPDLGSVAAGTLAFFLFFLLLNSREGFCGSAILLVHLPDETLSATSTADRYGETRPHMWVAGKGRGWAVDNAIWVA